MEKKPRKKRTKKEKPQVYLENPKLEYKVSWTRNNKPKERKYKMRAWAERCYNFIAYGIVSKSRSGMCKFRYKNDPIAIRRNEAGVFGYASRDLLPEKVKIYPGLDNCVLQARYVGEWFPIEFETEFENNHK